MPSPRPSGSGIWKILPLPHSLKDQILHLVTLFPYSSQPFISLVLSSGSLGHCVGSPCFAFILGRSGFLFLETVASKVSKLLTIETLYSPHILLLSLFLDVPFPRSEGWHRCGIIVVKFWAVVITNFGDICPSLVCQGVHSVCVTSLMRGGPRIVEFRHLLVLGNLFLPVLAVSHSTCCSPAIAFHLE